MATRLRIALIEIDVTYGSTSLHGQEGQEIIRVRSVACDLTEDEFCEVEIFQKYVKPSLKPFLTPLCTQITNIRQNEVDRAEPISTVLNDLEDWMRLNSISGIVSWGNIASQFVIECRLKSLKNPTKNLKQFELRRIFSEVFGRRVRLTEALSLRGIDHSVELFHQDGDIGNLSKLIVHEQQLRKVILDSLNKLSNRLL